MSFSGGVYTLPGPALVTGEVVSATENNQFRNDVATAFNLTMLRNGTSTATANLPMGGYKLTGLGAPTTNGDALSYGKAAVVTSLTSTALTATRVPYAGTGGLLQDASTFTFDGTTLTAGGFSTSGNISAATATVSGNITVSGGTANGVAYLNGSKVLTTGSALTFDGANLGVSNHVTIGDGSRYRWGDGTSVFLAASNAAGILGFYTGGSEQMRLTSTGLGIGTSSPASKLNVIGSFNASAAGSYPAILGGGSFGGGVGFNDSGVVAGIYTQGTGTNLMFFTGMSNTDTANSKVKMQLDGSGNLGLGVTPSTWSAGGFKAFQMPNGAALYANTSVAATYLGSNHYNDGGYKYATTAPATQYYQYNGTHVWQTAPSGTAGNAISFTQAMTLDASGNLGVGRTSPVNFGANWTGLEVAGKNTSSGGVIRVSTSDASVQADLYVDSLAVLRTATNHPLVFATNASERMRIDSSGNVGIGTSSPAGTLSVYTKAGAWSGNNYGKGLLVYTSAVTNPSIGIFDANNSNPLAITNNSGAFVISAMPAITDSTTGATERMRIDSSGNLLFNSGYGSVATAYGCRAWVNFNGTGTVTIRASGNVSSITDNGTGNYTVNFTTAMPDVNYSRCVTVGGNTTSTASNVQSPYNSTPTTTTLSVSTFNTAWSALQDCNDVNVAIFR